jgi:hypothetical protein
MIAITMTAISCTIPTAVITESSENTISTIAIWVMTAPKVAAAAAVWPSSSPSSEL